MIWVRKTNYKTVQTHGVPAGDLSRINAVRKTTNRNSGQYKIIFENNYEKQILNFKELKFYNNLILRNQHKHVVLSKEGDEVANVNIYSYPPGSCR